MGWMAYMQLFLNITSFFSIRKWKDMSYPYKNVSPSYDIHIQLRLIDIHIQLIMQIIKVYWYNSWQYEFQMMVGIQ